MLYIIENTDKLGIDFIQGAVPHLSIQRLRCLDGLKIEKDRVNCAACYLLLKKALLDEYGIDEKPEFIFGIHGKPALSKHPEIYFNFSHCREACACVVSDKPTAVDIADIRHISMRTAKYFCSADEYNKTKKHPDPTENLVRLWSIKECFSKLDGSGLFSDFKAITEENTKNLHTFKKNNYYCTYYSETVLEPVFVSADEILSEENFIKI